MVWILDLDGVIWRADTPIAGSAAAITSLRARGERVLFVTNNSSLTVAEYTAKLAHHRVACTPDELCTSAQAAASLVNAGETALVCAGAGVVEALHDRGVVCVREHTEAARIDAVVVGWHRDFDYSRLNAAFQAIRSGARFIATNDDPTYPTADGVVPGGGAIVAAVATASGVVATIAGKPYLPTVALVRSRLGVDDSDGSQTLTFVGDRASTDGHMALALGARFALVLSGVTNSADLPVDPMPAVIAADLAQLVRDSG